MHNHRITIAAMLLGASLFIGASNVVAEPLRATLADGREVVLHDDKTWEFSSVAQGTKAMAKPVAVIAPVATSAIVKPSNTVSNVVSSNTTTTPAIPSVTMKSTLPGTLIELNTGRSVDLAQRSGVTLTALPTRYDNGELVIPTTLKNDGTDAIVLVTLALRLHSVEGRLISTKEKKVWTSIKRMPETYFRPGTERKGQTLTFKVLSAEQYYLETEITEVEHW
ncbi:DUF3157 family protein [Photobacterium minamisatsumaniensis]|uniref:DUF3157 family protein n=1 Tax=Photobacterium minamisatsumaniensis TaxID=2910233 RepID=UPI003D125CB5